MKKLIAGIALAVASVAAHADVLTLFPVGGFGLLKQFHNIPNDQGLDGLYIYLSTTSPGIQYFQADEVGSIGWSCNGTADDPKFTENTPLSCSDGIVRTISYQLHSITVVRSCSGRGCSPRKTYWYFDGGAVTQ